MQSEINRVTDFFENISLLIQDICIIAHFLENTFLQLDYHLLPFVVQNDIGRR